MTCAGAVGVVATSVLTAKATLKASVILEEAKKEKGEELTTLEKINEVALTFTPPVLMGVGTIACIFGANVLNKKHQASLVSAYTMLDRSYKEYRNKVTELYGEEADEKVEEELAKDHCPRRK